MYNRADAYFEQMNKRKKTGRNTKQMIFVLSILIILSVFWGLKLTGVTMAGEAFCGMEEHVHTEDCVLTVEETSAEDTEAEGVCPYAEHVHDETCYSNIKADLETSSDWESSLEGIADGASSAERLVQVAKSQLGNGESTLNFTVENGTRRGITRYGQWYGNPYGDWSSMFASFCLNYAGFDNGKVPFNAGAESMRSGWNAAGLYQAATAESTDDLEAGDLLFMDRDGNGTADAVGIVTDISKSAKSGSMVTFIAGDWNDCVSEAELDLTDVSIMGYGKLDAAFRYAVDEEDQERVNHVIALIDALPTEAQVRKQMEGMDEESDEFISWYKSLSEQALEAYICWQDLYDDLRALVPDTKKMEDLTWTWEAEVTSAMPGKNLTIYQSNTNKYVDLGRTAIAYGGTAGTALDTNNSLRFWSAIVVEKSSDRLYVSQVISDKTNETNLRNVKANTSGGFVILVWRDGKDTLKEVIGTEVAVGSTVWVSSKDFYTSSKYSESGIGTITFTTPKNNENELNDFKGISTKDFVTMNLFDYGSNINDKWNSDKKYPGFQADSGTTSVVMNSAGYISSGSMNFGNNIKKENGAKVAGNGGTINTLYSGDAANRPISGAMYSTLKDGYPALSDGTSLMYLFSQNTYATKKNTANIDRLLQYDAETGTYYFNSRDNNAQFDPATNEFVLYEELITPNFIMYPFGNFLPLNSIVTEATKVTKINQAWFNTMANSALQKYYCNGDSQYNTLSSVLTTYVSLMNGKNSNWNYRSAMEEYFGASGLTLPDNDPAGEAHLDKLYSIDYDEASNFFFGMDMHTQFIQPKGGMTGNGAKYPMNYTFKGDDDVWIYIDGKLFLDLSGIHRHVGGEIDFKNGKVYYYNLLPATGEVSSEPYNTVTFAELLGSSADLNSDGTFKDYTVHTMDFYYMERGSGSGVCQMEFNLPLLRSNGIAVTKQLEGINGTEIQGNPDFHFQCYKEGGTQLLIGAGVEYTILDENGNKVGTGTTDSNGVFTIKAGQTASFGDILENSGRYFIRELLDSDVFEQYDNVIVDGTSITTDHGTDVTVGTSTFKGIDSDIKDMKDGSTIFQFTNKVDSTKLGMLKISKELVGHTNSSAKKEFTFRVEFDGEPVAKGTSYTLTDAKGNTSNKTVEKAGEIKLKHGESALFEKILAGTKVYIAESADSAEGYQVSYVAENLTVTQENGGASGIIEANKTGAVTVKNEPDGAHLTIKGDKTLLYPDGEKHEYSFILQQINSLEDRTAVEGGLSQREEISLKDGTEEFRFLIVYPDGTEAGTYYYLISEENADMAQGNDTSKYIAEVVVTENGGVITPELKQIYKVNDQSQDATDKVHFTNKIVRSLTIDKTVEPADTDTAFNFLVTVSVGDTAVEGEFPCTGLEGVTSVTFTAGKANVSLKHGQSITIQGLPYGSSWTVEEVNAYGYLVKCGVDGAEKISGTKTSGTLSEDRNVSFLNTLGVELPETGSNARMWYVVGGWCIIMFSLAYGFRTRRMKERRSK